MFGDEKHIGGRLATSEWHGVLLKHGAGIGRVKKDKRLQKLLRLTGIPGKRFHLRIDTTYSKSNMNQKEALILWRELHASTKSPSFERSHETFQSWATHIWGQKTYARFCRFVGYTDFEKADVIDVLNDYGMDDNMSSGEGINIAWMDLANRLKDMIRAEIYTQTLVTSVSLSDNVWNVSFESHTITARQVICGIPAPMNILPRNIRPRVVRTQPFIRVYGKINKVTSQPFISALEAGGVFNVPAPIQKVIPMNAEKDVYMIAYADNAAANVVHKHSDSTVWFEKQLNKAFGLRNGVHITDIKSFYWKAGTHYYAPHEEKNLKTLQNPAPGLFIVGEAVSRKQGWVEGALESVDTVMKML